MAWARLHCSNGSTGYVDDIVFFFRVHNTLPLREQKKKYQLLQIYNAEKGPKGKIVIMCRKEHTEQLMWRCGASDEKFGKLDDIVGPTSLDVCE